MKNLIFGAKVPFINNFLLHMSKFNREKMHNLFLNNTIYNDHCSVIDIGTTADTHSSNNIILEKTKNNKKIYCLSNQDIRFLKNKFPHIKKIFLGDAIKTNFSDNSFDIVFSSAVIEHVGSFQNQIKFI